MEALERIGDYGNTIAEIRSKYMGGEHDIVLSDQLSSIHDLELASFQRAAVGENDRCVQFEHVVNYVHTYLYLQRVTVWWWCMCVCMYVYMCVCVCVCLYVYVCPLCFKCIHWLRYFKNVVAHTEQDRGH